MISVCRHHVLKFRWSFFFVINIYSKIWTFWVLLLDFFFVILLFSNLFHHTIAQKSVFSHRKYMFIVDTRSRLSVLEYVVVVFFILWIFM